MKGKHAARTRNKREAEERYAIAVTELRRTKEKLENIEQLKYKNEVLANKLREVQELLKANTSPQIERAEAKIRKLQVELRESRKSHKKLQSNMERLMDYIRGSSFGTGVLEDLIEIATGEEVGVVQHSDGKSKDAEAAIRIQLARGKRTRDSAKKQLQRLEEVSEEHVEVRS